MPDKQSVALHQAPACAEATGIFFLQRTQTGDVVKPVDKTNLRMPALPNLLRLKLTGEACQSCPLELRKRRGREYSFLKIKQYRMYMYTVPILIHYSYAFT